MFVVLLFVIRLTSAFNHISVGDQIELTNLSFCALKYIKTAINSNSDHSITILLNDNPTEIIENSLKQIHGEHILIKMINIQSHNDDQMKNVLWFYSSINLNTFFKTIKCDDLNVSIHVIVYNESINFTPFLNQFQFCNLNIFHQIDPTSWKIIKIIEQNESKIIQKFVCNKNERNDNEDDDGLRSEKNEEENRKKENEENNISIENYSTNEEISTNDHMFGNDNETLVVYSLDSPPYMIFDEVHGFYDGIEYFALKEIAQQLNMSLRFELVDQAFDMRTLTNYMNLFR